MTEQELEQQRAQIWRLDGNSVRTVDAARSFLDAAGFCVMYPVRSLPLVPSFMGAYCGSSSGLPDAKHAFSDARSREATALMVRLLRERGAYEIKLLAETELIVSAQVFPFFYALLSDHNPKAPPKIKAQGAEVSLLAGNLFASIQKQGASWDVLYRWAADAVKDGIDISVPEAISALLSKYLEAAIAATQEEMEQFFSYLVPRSKIREATNALLAARELNFVTVGARSLIQMTPAVAPIEPQRHNHG